MSRRQNELVGKFKMAAGDKVSIMEQVMEYTYIPTGIKRALVRSDVDCDWKGCHQDCWWPFILEHRLFLVMPT